MVVAGPLSQSESGVIPVNDLVAGTIIYLFPIDARDAIRLNPSRYSLAPLPPVYGSGSDLGSFTVALLPAAPSGFSTAFATDGCKMGELTGAGTGVRVYYSGGTWRVFSTDAPVAS